MDNKTRTVEYTDIEKMFGQRFGKLVVLPYCFVEDIRDTDGKIIPSKRQYILKCQCDCGNIYYANRFQLLNDKLHSCGCEKSQRMVQMNKTYSQKYSDCDSQSTSKYNQLYNSWSAMKNRCLSVNNTHYEYYGGRGITICDEWLDYENFKSWALQNGWDNNLTIDRIDYNGNYEPNNCRWITQKEQTNNTSFNKMITYHNKTQSLAMWCEELGLNYGRIKARLNSCEMSVEEAFERRLYESHESYLIRKACEKEK